MQGRDLDSISFLCLSLPFSAPHISAAVTRMFGPARHSGAISAIPGTTLKIRR